MARLVFFCLAYALPIMLQAQSLLLTYKGGYFIRNGNNWYEYRPADKNGVWSTYTQYSVDDNYFYIKSSKDDVAVPRAKNNSVHIRRNGSWQSLYKTINIFNYCPDRSAQVFTHDRGFFVKIGSKWKEYLPAKKPYQLWADYDEYKTDNNYYYIKGSSCSVAVPRTPTQEFYVLRNNEWKVVYNTQALYDASSPNAKSGYNGANSSSHAASSVRAANSSNNRYGSSNVSQNYTSSKYYYWECSFAPDVYTGAMQFLRGNGTDYIKVISSSGTLTKVEESNQTYRVEYVGQEDGYEKYSTPWPLKQVWVQGKYVFIASLRSVRGPADYIERYNPQKGVVSGTQSDINRYDFGNNSRQNSSSSSYNNNSSSQRSSCSTCYGTGVNPQQSAGGSHYTWVAHYNRSGNLCRYCNRYNEHYHNRCPSCNVPRY